MNNTCVTSLTYYCVLFVSTFHAQYKAIFSYKSVEYAINAGTTVCVEI